MKNLLLVITTLCLIGCNGSDGGSASGGSSPEFKVLNLSISDSSIEEIRYSTNGMLYQISDGSIECKSDNTADIEVDTNFRSDIQFSIPCVENERDLERVFLNVLAFYAFEGLTLERTQGQNDGLEMRINGGAELSDFSTTYCPGLSDERTLDIEIFKSVIEESYEPDMSKFNEDYSYEHLYLIRSRRTSGHHHCHRNRVDGLPGDHNIHNFYDIASVYRHYKYIEGELEVFITRLFDNPFNQDEFFDPSMDIFHPDSNVDLNAFDDNGTFKVYRYERYQRQL